MSGGVSTAFARSMNSTVSYAIAPRSVWLDARTPADNRRHRVHRRKPLRQPTTTLSGGPSGRPGRALARLMIAELIAASGCVVRSSAAEVAMSRPSDDTAIVL